jgi:cyclic pyranopterin phosphate synthase
MTLKPMIDPFGRTIDYLRVSLTDRCNFRCVYCMPEQGFPATPKEEHLTADEFVRMVRIAASLGVTKVRLTGGEPLLRNDLAEIVGEISAIQGVTDLSCTTNGFLLAEKAADLKKAGLHRVNVSLDTLRSDRFEAIARRGNLQDVLDGIRTAKEVGLTPVKLNCVAMRGVNDGEAKDFAAWTIRDEIHVRFIELMPIRWNLDETGSFDSFEAHGGKGLLQLRQARGDMLSDMEMRRLFISAAEIKKRIEDAFGQLSPTEIPTNGPARTYQLPGAKGTIGFISQITSDFCSKCNRLRLTHDGFLRPCLMSDGELDLRGPLRNGASDADLRDLILHVVAHKPERHYLAEGQQVYGRGMSQIGG